MPPPWARLLVALHCVAYLASAGEIVVGNIRVQALSPTLLRMEPKGPLGFLDNTTFVVVDRDFPGIPIQKINTSSSGTWLATSNYHVHIGETGCTPKSNTDLDGGERVKEYPNGMSGVTLEQCCAKMQELTDCVGYVYSPSQKNCWLMATMLTTRPAKDREVGYAAPVVTVTTTSGQSLWSSALTGASNQLDWPSPLQSKAYGLKDHPRFIPPPWGPTPIPPNAHVDPALKATDGFDFRNNIDGDTYVFLLGDTMSSWTASRAEFIKLAGPTPLLPDYAFGTWFTYWHSYTQKEAEGEVQRWHDDKLPIDVWALDMNWRNTSNDQDHYYNHPDTRLFPDFPGWFKFLQSFGLKTYFNDHPFPQGPQTSEKEVSFRWEGLTKWLDNGLNYWWFDANWKFSIPPPFKTGSATGQSWQGMNNRAWGGYLYYTTVRRYNEEKRPKDRPMILNLFAHNKRANAPEHQHPSHHRYPVWWTGDGVTILAGLQAMVDQGVHDFKPYVHSDCGGDYRGSAGDLMRWISHCSLGTIIRLHGAAHQPWSYDNHTENIIRNYLNMRYQLMPSLISAGQAASKTAHPIVSRGDLFWPEHAADGANSNTQYLFLDHTLVAPIWETSTNETTRSVWLPPGTWQDAWSGHISTGPATIKVTQPYEKIPMWHQHGGFVITTSRPGLRVEEQDWSELTLEVFPGKEQVEVHRDLYSQGATTKQSISMSTASQGWKVQIDIGEPEDGAVRGWVVRLHLLPRRSVYHVEVDGKLRPFVTHLPRVVKDFFPFKGDGTGPAPHAGSLAEVRLPASSTKRSVVVSVEGR